MCKRNRSRPSSKRRLTKKLKRLSSGCSGFANAMGVVEEVKLSTNGPAASCGLPCSTAPWRAVPPDADLGVGVIESSPDRCVKPPPETGRVSRRDRSASVAPAARSWQPRRHRNTSFRPVALRPRLSTGLPLSLQVASVKASRMTVKRLYCVQPLRERLHSNYRQHMLNCLDVATLSEP
ncbi:MAG: hypothetical protein QOI59_1443 [Gammaproteobacteria bacterium]|jgi:hypothetical protein|nr:hypothetical protein [Gammaproteobacteria bacterium]